jgi:hypothetical protein
MDPLVAGDAPFVESFTPFIPCPLSGGEESLTFVISGRTDDLRQALPRLEKHQAIRQVTVFQGVGVGRGGQEWGRRRADLDR